ncbi:hypothetical protein M8J77_009411 [Diaphorina citri]|nr:hypothetical protein M8J77_009411 [Diaphorina citri]
MLVLLLLLLLCFSQLFSSCKCPPVGGPIYVLLPNLFWAFKIAASVHDKKTQWIGINQIIEDLAFEASVAMFIGLIEDLQVQGQQGQHLTFHI